MKQKILLSASLFHTLTDAASVVTPTLFPILYNQGFLINRYSQIGLLSNAGLVTTLLIQFLVVRLSVSVEYRRLFLLSGLGICASMAAIPLSRSFAALFLVFLLLRAFTSFYHPIVIAWISKSRSGSGKELDDAMGIQSGSGNVGVVLAYLTVGFMAQRWTWKTPLFAWSLLGLFLGGLGFLALRGVSSCGIGGAKGSLCVRGWLMTLKEIRRYIPGFFFGGMSWAVTIYYVPSLLNHRFGIPMGRTGLFLALLIGLGSLSGYGYGNLSRRFGRKTIFLLSLGGAAAMLFLIGLAPSRTMAVVGLLLYGGFMLMTYPSLHTFVGSTVPLERQTQAFCWFSNLQLVSGAFVSLASGFLSDAWGIHAPFLITGFLTLVVFLYYLPRGQQLDVFVSGS